MDDNSLMALAFVMAVPITAILGGIWLTAHKARLRVQAGSPEDHQQMQHLLDTARRMEQRIGYLENVLDTEAPGWRSRSEAR
jgi:phage shock protein B